MITPSFYIGTAAKQAGVTVKTVRFYEQSGLIPKAGRNAGKYRLFTPETVERIEFIRRAQALGFTLGEIGEVLSVYDQGDCSCGQVRKSVEQKLRVIDRKLRELETLKTDLLAVKGRLASQEDQRSPTICPVIHESQRPLKI